MPPGQLDPPGRSSEAFAVQRRRAEEQLQQRLRLAQRIHQLGRRSGNREMLQRADALSVRAKQLYEQQIERIESLGRTRAAPVGRAGRAAPHFRPHR
ncbi:MAG: hypothetical protein ACOC46_03130 [Pirellulales bacterium]